MGAIFAIGISTMGAGLAIGAAAIGTGFAIGALAIGVGSAIGASAIGRDVGAGIGFGLGFVNFGTLGIALGIGFESGAGSLAMRGISSDRVPLAVRGSAGICFHRGRATAAGASTLWTRSVGSDSSKSTSFIDAQNSDPVEHVKHKLFIIDS